MAAAAGEIFRAQIQGAQFVPERQTRNWLVRRRSSLLTYSIALFNNRTHPDVALACRLTSSQRMGVWRPRKKSA